MTKTKKQVAHELIRKYFKDPSQENFNLIYENDSIRTIIKKTARYRQVNGFEYRDIEQILWAKLPDIIGAWVRSEKRRKEKEEKSKPANFFPYLYRACCYNVIDTMKKHTTSDTCCMIFKSISLNKNTNDDDNGLIDIIPTDGDQEKVEKNEDSKENMRVFFDEMKELLSDIEYITLLLKIEGHNFEEMAEIVGKNHADYEFNIVSEINEKVFDNCMTRIKTKIKENWTEDQLANLLDLNP